jgi:hypothetical protein
MPAMKHSRLFLILFLTAPLETQAATARLLSEKQMTIVAASIVRGTVISSIPRRHSTGLIVTDVTLKVERLLKTDRPAASVQFTQLGGALGGKRLHVPGTSVYQVGEEVLVFLERGGGSLVELGVGAGKFRVLHQDGRALVERQLASLAFAVVDGRQSRVSPPPAATGPEPLDLFEARIASYLAE